MELYQHVRTVISILVGFCLTRLLSAAPQLAQPGRKRVYWVHLVWCLFMFFYVIGFWWWEFQLETVQRWTFPAYVFVAVYGAVVYFVCALISPHDLGHYQGYKEYFFSRRKWFFGAMAVMFLFDLSDDYIFHSVSPINQFRVGLFILLSFLAIRLTSERFHAAFALVALLSEILFYLHQFFTFA